MNKPTHPDDDDFSGLSTEERLQSLDEGILKPAEEIAGIRLRPISAGDYALLNAYSVGIVAGRTENIPFDVAAILFAQSHSREEVRALSVSEFRTKVFSFLDQYEPEVFLEATPIVVRLIERIHAGRAAVIGEAPKGSGSKKAGRRGS